MRLKVESEAGYRGFELPRRFCLDGRKVEVIENVDQWLGPDYRYFKVKCDDGNLYILRLDESRSEWDVTMFQRPEAEAFMGGQTKKPRRGDGP